MVLGIVYFVCFLYVSVVFVGLCRFLVGAYSYWGRAGVIIQSGYGHKDGRIRYRGPKRDKKDKETARISKKH